MCIGCPAVDSQIIFHKMVLTVLVHLKRACELSAMTWSKHRHQVILLVEFQTTVKNNAHCLLAAFLYRQYIEDAWGLASKAAIVIDILSKQCVWPVRLNTSRKVPEIQKKDFTSSQTIVFKRRNSTVFLHFMRSKWLSKHQRCSDTWKENPVLAPSLAALFALPKPAQWNFKIIKHKCPTNWYLPTSKWFSYYGSRIASQIYANQSITQKTWKKSFSEKKCLKSQHKTTQCLAQLTAMKRC